MNRAPHDRQGEGGSASLVPIDISETAPAKHELLLQTLNEAQVDFLLQRTPRREIKMRQGRGGKQFAYVEHGYVTERLNFVFGFNWDFIICDKQILEDEVIVEARLTVRTPGGQTIVKTQFGGSEIKRHASGPHSGKPLSIADDYKAAASDALKKCASLLGIGLDLYGRDQGEEEQALPIPQKQAPEPSEDVGARPAAVRITSPEPGLCTAKQLKEMAILMGQAGMTARELCSSLGISQLSDLTEARAERVIRRLRELAQGVQEREAS
jgi:hypothetical protein